jgi:hypothetical protein
LGGGSKGVDPTGRVAGSYNRTTKDIKLSEIYADEAAFSEEFFHGVQDFFYSSTGEERFNREFDSEAQLMIYAIELEAQNVRSGSGLEGEAAVLDNFDKSQNLFMRDIYGSGLLRLYIELDAARSIKITPEIQGFYFTNVLQNFQELNDQSGNPYRGEQRNLPPKAYNHIISESNQK